MIELAIEEICEQLDICISDFIQQEERESD
jgi:hypothetical protein